MILRLVVSVMGNIYVLPARLCQIQHVFDVAIASLYTLTRLISSGALHQIAYVIVNYL